MPARIIPDSDHVVNDPVVDGYIWDPATRTFDGPALLGQIVRRGWTVAEFAEASGLCRATLLHAVDGRPVRDRTVIEVLRSLATRPLLRAG